MMKSIRRLLMRSILLGGGGLWLLGAFSFYWIVRSELRSNFDVLLKERAENLANLIEWVPHHSDLEIEYEPGTGFAEIVAFRLVDANGEVLDSWGTMPSALEGELAGTPQGFTTLRDPESKKLLRCIHLEFQPRIEPAHLADTFEAPMLRLELARDLSPLLSFERWLGLAFLFGSGLSLALIALIGRWAIGNGLRPLAELGRHADRLDPTRPHSPFPGSEWEEIAPLTRRLNALMTKVHSTIERERRFSASVSHDLRTPVAELRTITEVALRRARDLDSLRTALGESHAVALEMEELATQLLEYLRFENPGKAPQIDSFDLDAVVRDHFSRCTALAARRKMTSTRQESTEAMILAPRAAVEQIVRALVENALSHAPENSNIDWAIEAADDGIRRLTISNLHQGLDAQDLDLLFEPFWQKRSDRGDRRHSGLGLALARAAAESFGANLRVALEGNRISFELTVRSSDAPDPFEETLPCVRFP